MKQNFELKRHKSNQQQTAQLIISKTFAVSRNWTLVKQKSKCCRLYSNKVCPTFETWRGWMPWGSVLQSEPVGQLPRRFIQVPIQLFVSTFSTAFEGNSFYNYSGDPKSENLINEPKCHLFNGTFDNKAWFNHLNTEVGTPLIWMTQLQIKG